MLVFCAGKFCSFKSITSHGMDGLAHNLINRICAEVGTTFAEYSGAQQSKSATFLSLKIKFF
jgi:hypothetical protein